MSESIGGAMALYFGNKSSELSIEEKLRRDIAALERSTKDAHKNGRNRKSRTKSRSKSKSKRTKRKKRGSNRTLKSRR